MKTVLAAVFFVTGWALLAEADFGQLYQEGVKAEKEKDFASAEARYGEAMAAAKDSRQKCQAVMGKYLALSSQKKWKEAETFALTAVEDEMLQPAESRHILNTVAGRMLWGNRMDFVLNLLQQAENLQCPKNSNVYFQTYFYMAKIYLRKKQPQAAIEVMEKVKDIKGQHPANLYTANMTIGEACEMLGKNDEALKFYRTALEYGKKVKYKFNYSLAEKAIERLDK